MNEDTFSNFVLNEMDTFAWTGRNIGLALLRQVPEEVPSDAPPALNDLVKAMGYQELAVPGYSRQTLGATAVVSGALRSIAIGTGSSFPVNITAPAHVVAGVFYLVGTHAGIINPWLFVTDVCFGGVVTPGAKVAATGDPSVVFKYAIQGSTVIPAIGQIVQAPGPTTWEPSRLYHVYLAPQRINWVPNPSFEEVGNFGWRSNGAITRMVGGVDHAANNFLRVASTRLEAIPAPTHNGPHRLSAYVRSATATWVQLGAVCWDINWDQGDVLGTQRPISAGWSLIETLILVPDLVAGVSFLAVANGTFDIDLVLMEDHADLNAYFDGDSDSGMVGDFSWQGVAHQSYSFWYNNRQMVAARVFGEYVEGLVKKQGLVYDWIPVDASLATHWDVISVTDTPHPLKDWDTRTIP